MYKKIFAAFYCSIFIVLTACGPKGVQSVRSLSEVYIGNLNVENIYVRLTPALNEQLSVRVVKLRELIVEKENELRILNERNRLSSGARTEAKKQIALAQKRMTSLERELVRIPNDIREKIENRMSEFAPGEKKVILNVLIYSFNLTNGATVLLVGGIDSMYGTVEVIDPVSLEKIGVYNVSEVDTNAAGGVLGVVVRGTDPRGDMINQFANKIVDALFIKNKPRA